MKKLAKICGALIAYAIILLGALIGGSALGFLIAFAWNGLTVLMPFAGIVDVFNTTGIFGGLSAVLMSCVVAPALIKAGKDGDVR